MLIDHWSYTERAVDENNWLYDGVVVENGVKLLWTTLWQRSARFTELHDRSNKLFEPSRFFGKFMDIVN